MAQWPAEKRKNSWYGVDDSITSRDKDEYLPILLVSMSFNELKERCI
jgi:hypothetical protein